VKTVLGVEGEAARAMLAEGCLPPPLEVRLEVVGQSRTFVLPRGARQTHLSKWPTPARRYLESRGVTPLQAERWGLGYAVEGRLAGRIVIPVCDADGRLRSYTARAFIKAAKKYLEPRTEEGAQRGYVFGERYWPELADRTRLYLGEGAFDAFAIERATGAAIAAVFGSQIDALEVMRIATFEEVIIASDPDAAGEKLACEVGAALERYVQVRYATMPAGHDACSLVEEQGERALCEALGVESPDSDRAAVPF
jgi:DNA primase